jgi:protoporphyrinogen oxidase
MDTDCIIVGSGIAGLYAAVELARLKRRVAVYEKHKEIGGRVYTFHQKINEIDLQWEAGAGRISEHHTIIIKLLKRYKLKYVPIGGGIQYKDTYTSDLEPDAFEAAIPIFLDPLIGLPQEDLEKHTIRELVTKIHGARKAAEYLIRFPYRAEIDVMRADMALKLFLGEFRRTERYGICAEGLSALTAALQADAEKRGVVFRMEHELVNINNEEATFKHGSEQVVVKAPQFILALTCEALRELGPFKKWHVLKHIRMEPLLRFYGAFPKEDGKLWYEKYGGRIVTSTPIRYMIPGSAVIGSAQMSYTDSQDARYWIEKLHADGEKKVGEEMLAELRKLLSPSIPPPFFVKAHAWDHGVTYWLPGHYDPAKLSKEAVTPFPETMPAIHVCGESFSLRQGWMEGAVEHAALVVKKLLRR